MDDEMLMELLQRLSRIEERLNILNAHSHRIEVLERSIRDIDARITKMFAMGAAALLLVQLLSPFILTIFRTHLLN